MKTNHNTARASSGIKDENGNFQEVRAITLWQPWASLIAVGLKRFETRSWATGYRGKLLIHAAKRPVNNDGIYVWEQAHKLKQLSCCDARHLPTGEIVAAVDLIDCFQMENITSSYCDINHYRISINLQSEIEKTCGDWQVGRFAWKLENVEALKEPIPAKGMQQIWYPDKQLVDGIFSKQKFTFNPQHSIF